MEHCPHGKTRNPERIFQARRAAVRYGLMDTGIDEATANRWSDAWELEAASRGLSRDGAYWDAGRRWIAAERGARRAGRCCRE